MTIVHGIQVFEPVTGARAINGRSSAVIGLIAHASDAAADVFPLNTAVLVPDIRAAIADAGVAGTLSKALIDIANQGSPILIVVRVLEGVTAGEISAEEAMTANAIGSMAGGSYTGMQAFLAAEAQLGVRPQILGAPGFDTQDVTNALIIVAKRLNAFVYASCRDCEDVSDAVTYVGEFAARELMLIWPDFTGWDGRAIAVALGLRAALDESVGWHKSLSNVAVDGVSGLTKDLYFDIQDSSTPAGVLNNALVTTLVHMRGYRFWGNRTTSDEPAFAFETAVRTAQALRQTIADGLVWAIDKPLTVGLARDIIETINAAFRQLKSEGRIIDGKAWFDPSLNSAGQLAAGKLVIDFDYTPVSPLENLQLNMRITDKYYASFGDQLAAA
ncbi:MAG: bacteriophage major tail sheath protein [Novosphingobium sp.]|nr:bacteriophage major tail sheath protein [Novosphingobium sp.]